MELTEVLKHLRDLFTERLEQASATGAGSGLEAARIDGKVGAYSSVIDELDVWIQMAALKAAGCKCYRPLLGHRSGGAGVWKPRCRTCDVVAREYKECESVE